MLLKISNPMESVIFEHLDRVVWRQIVFRDHSDDLDFDSDYPFMVYYPDAIKRQGPDSVNLEHEVEYWDQAYYNLPYKNTPPKSISLLTYYGSEDIDVEPQKLIPGLELRLILEDTRDQVILASHLYDVYLLNNDGKTVDRLKCLKYVEPTIEEGKELNS